MNCGFDLGYRLAASRLHLCPADTGLPQGYRLLPDANIRSWVSAHYADLLDAWASSLAVPDRFELACRLAYRGELLQWNGYAAAWWEGVLTLVGEATTGGLDPNWTVVSEAREIPLSLLRALLRRRRHPTSAARLLDRMALGAALVAGYAAGAAEYLAAWARHRRFGRPFQGSKATLVFVFADDDNTTKHVYRWLRTLRPAEFTPYVLGSPLRALRSRREWASSSLPTVGEFLRGLWLGGKAIRVYGTMASSSASFVLHGGRSGWKRILLNGSRLLRQGIHRSRLASGTDLPDTAVFSLQGAEGILLDAYLQQRQVRTIHWLHGILASRRNLDGLSTLALTKSSADARELSVHGHYGKALNALRSASGVNPDFLQTDSSAAPYLLALTTIFHPTRVPSDEIKLKELVDYLEIVSRLAQRLKCRAIWRPHPCEVADNRMALVSDRLDHNLVTIDYQTPLRQQIEGARHTLTTVSGTILDVLAAGRVPSVYRGAFYEDAGIPAGIPRELFFQSLPEAEGVLALLRDKAVCRDFFLQLTRALAFDRDYLPAGTSFDVIAREQPARP